VRDFKHPDCIVVGTHNERARELMGEIYRPLYLNQAPIMYTGRRAAELIKYAAEDLTNRGFLYQSVGQARKPEAWSTSSRLRRSAGQNGFIVAGLAKCPKTLRFL
jgi:hypothetical protein